MFSPKTVSCKKGLRVREESQAVIQVAVVFSVNTGVRPAVPVDKYKEIHAMNLVSGQIRRSVGIVFVLIHVLHVCLQAPTRT